MNIEDQKRNLNFKDPNEVIKFYESNRLYFDNFERLESEEKVSEFIDIKLHYANSLTDKHYLEKVFSVLDEVSKLLEKLPKNHWNFVQSERHMRFLKGMALANQKKFKESYPIFKQLIKEDSDHYYYKLWFQHTKFGLYDWIFNWTAGLGIGLLLIDMFFYIILKSPLHVEVAKIGIIIIAVAYIAQFAMKHYLKNKKTAPNNG
jgi:hypothetical protein